MKGTVAILSFLMLFLSLKPCSDRVSPEGKYIDEINVNHNHQKDNDDSCPVTCICNCCEISITYELINPPNLKMNLDISALVLSEYQSNYKFDSLTNIWQPPQLIS